MAPSSFKLAIAICVCLPLTICQRRSVCGPGPHVLNQTGIDVYLLPGTNVTLQPVPSTNNQTRVKWRVSRDNNTEQRIRSKTREEGDNLRIGPMDKSLNLVPVWYRQPRSTSPPYVSSRAVLHLAESEVSVTVDKGYTNGQEIQVTAGSAQRVFCYTITPINKGTGRVFIPLDYNLTKAQLETPKKFRSVPRDRYYNNGSCLWMDSLQLNDNGFYRLLIKTCFSSSYGVTIRFSISVTQSTAPSVRTSTLSSSKRTSSRQASTEVISQSTQIPQSTTVALTTTNITPVSTTGCIPGTLQLTLNHGGGHMKLGILTFYVSVNTTLKVSFNVTGRCTPTVAVQHNGQKVNSDKVKKKRLRLGNVQKSDSGLYQVIATDDEERVTSNFTLVVQDETLITSPYPTTSQIETSGPSIDSNITGARNITYPRYPTRTMTIPTTATLLDTRTSTSERGTSAAQADGTQAWVFVIIVLFILLAILIPTVYIVYRRRHSLRSHSIDGGRQPTNPVYWNDTYGIVVKPTVSPNSELEEVTTRSVHGIDETAQTHCATYTNVQDIAAERTSNELPDIIATSTAQNNVATAVTKEENTELSPVADATNKDHGTGPMPIYATVHKENKPAQNTSHTFKVEETKSPHTSATLYAELSTPTPNREHKPPDAVTAKPPTQQHTIQYVELDIGRSSH